MFDFDAVSEQDAKAFLQLGEEPVFTLDGEFGSISHLLVSPSSRRAEWAVVVDGRGDHHAIPVLLFAQDEENDENVLRVGLLSVVIESLLGVADPGKSTPRQVIRSVRSALTALTDDQAIHVEDGFEVVRALPVGLAAELSVGLASVEAHPADFMTISLGDYQPMSATPSTAVDVSGSLGDIEQFDCQPLNVRDGVAAVPTRSMVADLPNTVRVGSRFSIQVLIAENSPKSPYAVELPAVIGGSTVTVDASVPESFMVHGELTQDISVPLEGNSDPVLFSFTPGVVGTFPLRLAAFAGGSYLGQLQIELSVGSRTSGTSRESTSTLSAGTHNGEVSLQITYDEGSQTFRFLFIADGDRREVPSQPIQGNLRRRIETLVAELDSYARADAGVSQIETQRLIRIRGFELWRDLVPDRIKAAVLDHLDDITQLTIFCDREVVPWELLYPQTPGGDEPGFLVSQFPVNRWIMDDPWTRRLSLADPAFVVPDPAPREAELETNGIARALGLQRPVILRNRQQVLDALTNPQFGFLHFACHNRYSADVGSRIGFHDGALSPSDLALSAAARPLRDTKSLIFLNACRSHGEAPVYTSFDGWAKTFLALGATAVIGTSWSVRDATARPFAETVYERLEAGDTLGTSVAEARTRTSTSLGDSTWLAYSVYGDPNARAEQA